jgi:hypothetical protein
MVLSQPNEMPEIQSYFPRATLHGLDAGHWLHAEKPADYFNVTSKFLDS